MRTIFSPLNSTLSTQDKIKRVITIAELIDRGDRRRRCQHLSRWLIIIISYRQSSLSEALELFFSKQHRATNKNYASHIKEAIRRK